MYTNEILEEKYRVQKKLSEEAKDVRDFIRQTNEAAKRIEEQYGFKFKYVTKDDIPQETKNENE